MASQQTTQSIASGDLLDLVVSSAPNSGLTTIYPSEDTILSVLQSRFRADLPYTRVGAGHVVAVNPYKTLGSLGDGSSREYERRSFFVGGGGEDRGGGGGGGGVDEPRAMQPHLYDLAARVYLMMRRTGEAQGVLARGITASGKSTSLRLLTNQLLLLSSPTNKREQRKLSDQIKSLYTILDSFGNAKSLMNPNASRHSRYTEFHFSSSTGTIQGAKILAFALDKTRLTHLSHEERTYHVFYQLLAGASPAERDQWQLDDPSEYALLASSGCYRLPSGPFSDDAIAFGDLRAALKAMGFKTKHVQSIFNILVAILLLGNVQFAPGDAHDVSASIANPHVLEHACRLLGLGVGVGNNNSVEEMEQILTNKTSYVRKELFTVLLSAKQSEEQRDACVKALYGILFAFIVETCNHRLAPPPNSPNPEDASTTQPQTQQIILLDLPGYQTRGPAGTTSMSLSGTQPLVSAYGTNGFEEFLINFSDELLHSFVVRSMFDDADGWNGALARDGVVLPVVEVMDNSACVELLRGVGVGVSEEKEKRKPGGVLGVINKACSAFKAGKSGEARDEELVRDLSAKFAVHSSFVSSSSSSSSKLQFGINHYAGSATYDASSFIEKDTDLVDSAFVSLLRSSSSDPFVGKLLSGPSLAAERHSKDESIIVQAQVSSRPLRSPTPIVGGDHMGGQHARLDANKTYPVSTQINSTLSEIFASLASLTSNTNSNALWHITCIRPNDSSSPNSFDKRRVKNQIRSLLLPSIVARKSLTPCDAVVRYTKQTFCDRYVPTMRGGDAERIEQCARANGWRVGVDYVVGEKCVWVGYAPWRMVEDVLRAQEDRDRPGDRDVMMEEDEFVDDNTDFTHGSLAPPATPGGGGGGYFGDSADNLLLNRLGPDGTRYQDPNSQYGNGGLRTPNMPYGRGGGGGGGGRGFADDADPDAWGSDYDKKDPGSPQVLPYSSSSAGLKGSPTNGNGIGGMTVKDAPNAVEELPTTGARRWWLRLVWLTTWPIPSFLLHHIGRMKRPDVRLAWREKLTIFWLIFLFNAIVIFYIVEFGRLLCPNFDRAWGVNEVNQHQGDADFWVAIQGSVYDVSNFVHGDHSNGFFGIRSNSPDVLDAMAGQDLTYYFPPPLVLGCAGLVTDDTLFLTRQNWSDFAPLAHHVSGKLQTQAPDMEQPDWYTTRFLPKMRTMRKGPLVWERKVVAAMAADNNIAKIWGIYKTKLFDLTDYVYTLGLSQNNPSLAYLDQDFVSIFTSQSGKDVSTSLDFVLNSMNSTYRAQHLACMENVFYVGEADFRKSARCQVQNYLLIVISVILMASILMKFLAALQLGSRRQPELQDKFVLCQVPCYTEGEDSLRRTIDSLAALNYDDKRKLIFIICDGNIIGSGNDRTTPRIVLDILGVDPGVDCEPLLFKSVGEGSKALNYGKIYSGLYEFEGHVVPYMVVVKVGKPSERSKPGNRGKRDSQILVMHYLNRVHFDMPMSPLELEIYHQMRNVIGIDPAFYEYIFTVDADTTVTPDSLNRLVAASADDSSIIGICGETKLTNEEGSWWTMIQVYEYYISHHLSKAFESLFGSVTCLPGCFTLYRIRTADKGRPIIISNRIIEEYAEPNVDTLHKKNLFSLGEDRFLTTLMMKHFPTFKTKFTPDAVAHTMAPESWRVLFSQRRRWINSTVHNLLELVILPELFGFCCFSMRFFVFIDLVGTMILPATVVYLVYLISVVALGKAALPTIALAMLAVTYGLQALIFIIKREFMLVGWMVVYLLSYPVYSFFLPIYSFWCMDEFSWGNTRVVIGEGKDKKVINNEDEKFDESMIPLKKFSEYEAEAWETATHRSEDTGYESKARSRSQAPRSRGESPQPYNNNNVMNQASQSGDYYRDTNVTYNNSSNPNLRLGPGGFGGSQSQHGSGSNISHQQLQQQQAVVSPFGVGGIPQLPFMPFGGSVGGGSDYGGGGGGGMPMMGMGMGMPTPLGYQNTGSMYGMMPPPVGVGVGAAGAGPRNTMMSSNMNMFGGGGGNSASGSQNGAGGGGGGGVLVPPMLPQQRPMSTFSMATTVNPFAGPSMNPSPSDEDLFNALRNYLSTQDLMSVTKKTAREAIMAKFPKADLASRKDYLNQSIDKILSES